VPSDPDLAADLVRALSAEGEQLAPAALAIARLEHPRLDPGPYLEQLDRFGQEAGRRVQHAASPREAVLALNQYVFGTLGFAGNREQYIDPRNSFLNVVLERRIGLPITLSIAYIEIGRRAGLPLAGVGFPGHFLARLSPDLVVDCFNGGALLSEFDCVNLLREHAGEQAQWSPRLLDAVDRRAIVIRMLTNLKRAYVGLRSFEHARRTSDLLIAVDPSAITELRDRGLLSYHLQDFSAAMRDLERYLQLIPRAAEPGDEDESGESEGETEAREEFKAIWDHVKNLRRRVASFN